MTEAPTKGRIVLVTTPDMPVGGDTEHAAIVTKVHSATEINVMSFPGDGVAMAFAEVDYADPPAAIARSWRWPPRE